MAQRQGLQTHLVDDPLDQVKFALQRCVQQESQRVELNPEAVAGALGLWLLQVCALGRGVEQESSVV